MHDAAKNKFMEEEGGKVLSGYGVDITSSRTWFEGVQLIDQELMCWGYFCLPPTNFANRVFKIMLLNNDATFFKESGSSEFRAGKDESGGQEFKFIAGV